MACATSSSTWPMVARSTSRTASDRNPLDLDARLDALDLTDQEIVGAGWTDGLRDFQLDLADGRTIHFSDCLRSESPRPRRPPGRPRPDRPGDRRGRLDRWPARLPARPGRWSHDPLLGLPPIGIPSTSTPAWTPST